MTPLLDVFEYIRKKKRILKSSLREALDMTPQAFNAMYRSKKIPNELIFGFVSHLEIDARQLDSLFQYNELQQLICSLPEVVCGRIVSEELRRKVGTILYFDLDILLDHTKYLHKIHVLPREIHETIYDLEYQ